MASNEGSHEELSAFVVAVRDRLKARAVAVFGSRARSDHLPDSDYDIVVISDDLEGLNPYERRLLIYSLWCDTGPRQAADVFGLTGAELLSMRSPIVWDMLQDGHALYDDGVWEQARHEFDRRKALGYLTPIDGGWKIAEGPAGEDPRS